MRIRTLMPGLLLLQGVPPPRPFQALGGALSLIVFLLFVLIILTAVIALFRFGVKPRINQMTDAINRLADGQKGLSEELKRIEGELRK